MTRDEKVLTRDDSDVCQPAISNQVIWVYLSMNVVTDLYLISIPVPMLWQSSLKPVKKFGLIILFSGGLFVVACAILRCALIVAVSLMYPGGAAQSVAIHQLTVTS